MYLGKIIAITGAAGGLGSELVTFFALEGATVIALDSSAKSLKSLQERVEQLGLQIDSHQIDLTDFAALDNIIQTLWKKYRGIDYWFNNAGRSIAKTFSAISNDDFSAVMRLNFDVPRIATKALIPKMTQRGVGCIVNVASVAGHVPSPMLSAYVASKHALVGLTRSIQEELKLENSPLCLVLVSPGFVNTAMITAEGSGRDFPSWLGWMVSEPKNIIAAIDSGLRRGATEINPDLSGKVTRLAHRLMPNTTVKYSKMALSSGLKDFLLGKINL